MFYYQSLQRNAAILGNQVATIFDQRQHTWQQVEQRVARLSAGLIKHGVTAGSHVAILSLNSDRYYEYFNAVPWVAGVVVPLNIRWSLKENVYSLDNSQSSVLFVDDTFLEMGKQLIEQCENVNLVIYMGEGQTPDGMLNYEQLIEQNEPVQPIAANYNDLAGIYYTGGTTGFPKGVMLSHSNVWNSSVCVSAELGMNREGERYLHAAPMFHLADVGISYAAVIGGLTQVFVSAFEPNNVVAAIKEHQVTDILLVPTMVTLLLANPKFDGKDVASLKNIIYGASPMPEGTLIEAMEKMPTVCFTQAYGQSEMAPLISILAPKYHVLSGEHSGKIRSAGRAGYCIKVEIRLADGTTAKTGEIGEIAAFGPNSMMGYWNNPEQTASAIIDGWVMTGDAGYLDEDGFLFLVDRVKDMIITGGENVFSVEVENALSFHPSIQESVVIGIPDEKWGEGVHAIVRFKEGESATQDEIISHCREHIANYKLPRSIEVRAEPFPVTGAGKLRKAELKKPYWADKGRSIN